MYSASDNNTIEEVSDKSNHRIGALNNSHFQRSDVRD